MIIANFFYLIIVHQNYVAADHERYPVFLSVVLSEGGDQCVSQYRVILWRRTVSYFLKTKKNSKN